MFSDATFYNWRKKYAGLKPSEMKRLRQLEGGECQAEADRCRSVSGQGHASGKVGSESLGTTRLFGAQD